MTPVSLDARARYFFATDIAVFVLGAAIIGCLGLVPRVFSPLALLLLIIALGLGLGFDMLRWHVRGIRSIQLGDERLTLYSGKTLAISHVERREVTAVSVASRLGRRTAVLLFAKGKKARIAEDAFPREAFTRFLKALTEWAGKPESARRR